MTEGEFTLDELDNDPCISGAAQCFYQAERVSTLGAKYPDKSQHELITLAIKEWNLDMAIQKKTRYLRLVEKMGLARALKNRHYILASQNSQNPTATTPTPKRTHLTISSFNTANVSLSELLKREPKKPPKNGYSLFTSEQLAKYVNVEPQKRMSEVARIWTQVITKEEKQNYDARIKELIAQHQRELNAFIETLNPEERQVYQEYKNSKIKPKKVKAPKY